MNYQMFLLISLVTFIVYFAHQRDIKIKLPLGIEIELPKLK
jgi:hypothetical protein